MQQGAIDGKPPTLPPLRRGATALDATEVLIAPCAGLVVWLRELGDVLAAGDAVVEVIEPITGVVSTLTSRQDGVFLARDHQRYTAAGRSLAKIVGEASVRSGKLSGD
jgi:predicted deacylase